MHGSHRGSPLVETSTVSFSDPQCHPPPHQRHPLALPHPPPQLAPAAGGNAHLLALWLRLFEPLNKQRSRKGLTADEWRHDRGGGRQGDSPPGCRKAPHQSESVGLNLTGPAGEAVLIHSLSDVPEGFS